MLETFKPLLCAAALSTLSACAAGKVDSSGPSGRTRDTGSEDVSVDSSEGETGDDPSDTDRPSTDEPKDTNDTGTPVDTGDPDTGGSCGLEIVERLDVPSLPSGWTIEDGDEDGYTWEWNNDINNIGYGAQGGYYWLDAGAAGDVVQRERILTAVYEKGACTAITLNFAHYFNYSNAEKGHVVLQRDDADWEDVKVYGSTENASESIDLTPFIEDAVNFRVGFFYNGNGSYYWKVDNIEIRGVK